MSESNEVEQFRQTIGDSIRLSMRVDEVRYYGQIQAWLFADGRVQIMKPRDWNRAEVYRATPFERLQLGLEMPGCAPETDFLWISEQLTRTTETLKKLLTEAGLVKPAVAMLNAVSEQTGPESTSAER